MRNIKPIELPSIPSGGGLITEVSIQRKDPDRCSIFLDGTFAFGVHVTLALEAGIKKGQQLSEQDCLSLAEKDVYHKAWKRCLDYIAYRQRTLHEVRTRLKELQVQDSIKDSIESRLLSLGYVNDQEFARQWAESRVRSKGFGPKRLKNELRKKGIPADLADEAVAEACSSEMVSEQLSQQMDQALRRYRNEKDDQKKRQKLVGFLARRGFETGDILREYDQRSTS